MYNIVEDFGKVYISMSITIFSQEIDDGTQKSIISQTFYLTEFLFTLAESIKKILKMCVKIILSFYNCIIVYYTNMKKVVGYKNNTNCALLSYILLLNAHFTLIFDNVIFLTKYLKTSTCTYVNKNPMQIFIHCILLHLLDF